MGRRYLAIRGGKQEAEIEFASGRKSEAVLDVVLHRGRWLSSS
jgi:hypothetical protein